MLGAAPGARDTGLSWKPCGSFPLRGVGGNQAKTGQDCDKLQACWPRRGPCGASECDLAREVQAGCPEDARAESNRMEGRVLSRGWKECSWEAEAREWGVEAGGSHARLGRAGQGLDLRSGDLWGSGADGRGPGRGGESGTVNQAGAGRPGDPPVPAQQTGARGGRRGASCSKTPRSCPGTAARVRPLGLQTACGVREHARPARRLCEPPCFSGSRRGSEGLPGAMSGEEAAAGAGVRVGAGWPALVFHATLGSQAGGAVCPGAALGPDPQTPSRSLGLALHSENPDPDSASARRGTATAPRITGGLRVSGCAQDGEGGGGLS